MNLSVYTVSFYSSTKAFKATENTAIEIPVSGNSNHHGKKVRNPGLWRGLNQKGIIIREK